MPDRTVAIFQTAGPAKHTVIYELAYAELEGSTVTLHTRQPEMHDLWTTEGIASKGGDGDLVRPDAGSLFLDALRDQFSKGGRCFALDSAKGDRIPPSLLQQELSAK